MPFFDHTLERTIAYDINVDNSAAALTAITIFKINSGDRIADAVQLSVGPGLRTTLTDTPGPRISRIIIAVHPVGNAFVGIEIRQGALTLSQPCFGDTDIVFDTKA